jgi:hypothetical protein
MDFLTTIGSAAACLGLLFFLFCAALLFWYLFNQPKQDVSAVAPVPPVQSTIEHPSAGTPSSAVQEPASAANETSHIDG